MEKIQQENPGGENPFLQACTQMFKDFEKAEQNEQSD